MATKNTIQFPPHTADSFAKEVQGLRQAMQYHLRCSVAKTVQHATALDWFHVTTYAIRDRLSERWVQTENSYITHDKKRVYYLSMEYLTGRILCNSLLNLGLYEACCQALTELGLSPQSVFEIEPEPALGNGGLGRLAACFLDSMASLDLPAYAYGIRYEYGMFYQEICDEQQVELPDNWLRYGNPWEFPRPEVRYTIKFGGQVTEKSDEWGYQTYYWEAEEEVVAMAYDIPITGYDTETVNNLRLWEAQSSRDFDLQYFNQGDYLKAVEHKNYSENLSKVLYPSDSTKKGRELRLKQEYFFVSASIQDIVQRHLNQHDSLVGLEEYAAIQLNDTHPTLAIPELLHILLDQQKLPWEEAWQVCQACFSYTNHTLLPEALETWSVALLAQYLPRHLQIIYEINHRFLADVRQHFPDDTPRLQRMSLISEEGERQVRMSHLAFVASHCVNGVAALHTRLMKETLFHDFHALYPERIVNKTNGITPRRWLQEANPRLSHFLIELIGDTWLKDLSQLNKLLPLVDDPTIQQQFAEIKQENKKQLQQYIFEQTGINVHPESLFDVHIKRIHEYKRQLLTILHVITRYNRIRADAEQDFIPRTVIFAGKAPVGYQMAKLLIQLIHKIAKVVNNDPVVGDRLKVVFLENYNVSQAMHIIPAADLSEQISTAGMEASGTGNMKLALNGALTIGTLDGATVEIKEAVGEENIFIFGNTAKDVQQLRDTDYDPCQYYRYNPSLKTALDMINTGYFSPNDPHLFYPLYHSLIHDGDYFMVLADYEAYISCQDQVDKLYQTPKEWTKKALLNVSNMGQFSSDRCIKEYAKDIWQIV